VVRSPASLGLRWGGREKEGERRVICGHSKKRSGKRLPTTASNYPKKNNNAKLLNGQTESRSEKKSTAKDAVKETSNIEGV